MDRTNMASRANVSLLSRFKASMAGAVIGDCLGSPFEGYLHIDTRSILALVDDVEKKRVTRLKYTDDTAMLRSVACSLIENKRLDIKDLAKRFSTEYFNEPYRGYGGSVADVFRSLRDQRYANPHGPATEQFNGQGSYGNGGSMRVAPAALYGYNMDEKELDQMVADMTKITHSHCDAINGAILQCSAVLRALKEDNGHLDPRTFTEKLVRKMCLVESDSAQRAAKRRHTQTMPYCDKLRIISEYLSSRTDPNEKEFSKNIGTGVAASEAVPAAIYSFLRCFKPVASLPNRSGFELTILHAISLGGDTDTIASMCGAIAGAYYGMQAIPPAWLQVCEGANEALEYGEKLFELSEAVGKP